MCWNARGFHNYSNAYKPLTINNLLINHNVQLLIITETHMDKDNPRPSHIIHLPNTLHAPFTNRSGGISFHSSSPMVRRPLFEMKCSNCIAAEIQSPHGPILVVGYYHLVDSEHKHYNEMISIMNNVIQNVSIPYLFIGDFNIKHSNWQNLRPGEAISHGRNRFASIIDDNNLTLLNTHFQSTHKVATHIHGGVLDLAITNTPSLWSDMEIIDDDRWNDLHGDHYPILLSYSQPLTDDNNVSSNIITYDAPKWNIKSQRWNEFRDQCIDYATFALHNIRSQQLLNNRPSQDIVDQLWDYAHQTYSNVAHATIGTLQRHHPKYWWKNHPYLDQLLHDVRVAKQHCRRYHHSPNYKQLKETYRLALHNFKDAVLQAKRDSFQELTSSIEDKELKLHWEKWQRTQGSTVTNLQCVTDRNGHIPRDIHHALNNMAQHLQFVSSLDDIKSHDKKHDDKITQFINNNRRAHEVHPTLENEFTIEEVKDACWKYPKLSSAMGPDFVSPYFLKHSPIEMIELLTIIINYSWNNGYLPSIWTKADVVLLAKPGAPSSSPDSYRPISLTSVVAKTMEQLVHQRLTPIINNKLHHQQSGFRERHACFDNLYHILYSIRKKWEMNKGQQRRFDAVFLDFSKAFDRTWREGILYQLHKRFGIQGKAWRWIKAFLFNRFLRVVSQGFTSEWYPTTAGVPQGAVLSPILFTSYIDEITTCNPLLEFLLYADDIVVWPKNNNSLFMRQFLEAGLVNVLDWCVKWKVVINGSKSGAMSFHPTKKSYSNPNLGRSKAHFDLIEDISVRSHQYPTYPTLHIQQVQRYSYLGLVLDEQLNWKAHSLRVIDKVRIISQQITRIINFNAPPSHRTICKLVKACLISVISYGMPLWKPHPSIILKLKAAIARPLIAALGLPYNTEHQAVLCYLGIPDIESIMNIQTIQSARRIALLPNNHHVHSLWSTETWNINDSKDWPVYHSLKPYGLSPMITQTLNQLRWLDQNGSPIFPNEFRSLKNEWKLIVNNNQSIPTRVLQHQFMIWFNNPHSRLHKQLSEQYNNNSNRPSFHLSIDSIPVARARARIRFDRTLLDEARRRHSRRRDSNTSSISKICPTCNLPGSVDNVEHYLLHCQAPTMNTARYQGFLSIYYPIKSYYHQEFKSSTHIIPYDAIIAFTDGSSIKNERQMAMGGAASVVSFPPLDRQENRIQILLDKVVPQSLIHASEQKIINDNPSWSIRSEPIPHGTNNICELVAIYLALDSIYSYLLMNPSSTNDIIIMSDSQWTINMLVGMNKPTKHIKLIQAIQSHLQQLTGHGYRKISMYWCKAHHELGCNNHVDLLAKKASTQASNEHDSYHQNHPFTQHRKCTRKCALLMLKNQLSQLIIDNPRQFTPTRIIPSQNGYLDQLMKSQLSVSSIINPILSNPDHLKLGPLAQQSLIKGTGVMIQLLSAVRPI